MSRYTPRWRPTLQSLRDTMTYCGHAETSRPGLAITDTVRCSRDPTQVLLLPVQAELFLAELFQSVSLLAVS
jgi:hypothetical protein